MTLLEFLRQWQPSRLTAGVIVSVFLHVAAAALILWAQPAVPKSVQKKGNALFVELPKLDESPPPGPPGSTGPVARPAPAPERPPVAARPAPPRAVAKPAPPAPRREAERRVAAAPPTPQATEPAPLPRVTETPPAPASRAPDTAPADPQAPYAPEVAAVTPGRKIPPAPDVRSALGRGGGGGGHGLDRGGIEGEPVPLDTKDPRYSDYFEQIRQRIKAKWGFPCVKQGVDCDYKTTELLVEFGIAKDGHLAFVNLRYPSPWTIYDDYALNAIRLASPFPPVPEELLRGNGVAIAARFSYVVERGFTNILR